MARIGPGVSALLLLLGTAGGSIAYADDFPPRKPGLWQIEMTSAGRPPQLMKMCIDTNTDAEMYKLGMSAAQGMCDKPEIHRNGSSVTVDATCKMGPSQTTTHSVTQFTGDAAYHTDATTKFDPPMMGINQASMMQDVKWAGPCPGDMQAGDMLMGNGMKMNIKQMLGGKP